jgi:hypothetical protein
MAANKEITFAPVGSGVEAAIDGQTLLIRVPLDKAKGFASGSGKMTLTASTGGWQTIAGTEGFRLNVMGGYKA